MISSHPTKSKSHLTAISRKTLPVPTRWLLNHNHIFGEILDYGCGHCHEINNKFFTADGYDPHYRPSGLPKGKLYDTILCIYVLCTIPTRKEKIAILKHIQSLLTFSGIAFIVVRNDQPQQGWGWSSRGTYQGRNEGLSLPLIREVKPYRIYQLTRRPKIV